MRKLLFFLLVVFFLGCEKNNKGKSSLINLTEELAGDNCASAGYKIEVGIDENRNDILDVEEVESTQYICNGNTGSDGLNSLVNVNEELAD